MTVVGVDGCRGGWIAAALDRALTLRIHASFRDLLASYPDADAIAVDIPIGLSDVGRGCDVAARRVLSSPRCCSVFTPPSRDALGQLAPDGSRWMLPDYRGACQLNERATGKRLSRQAYGILPKIAEVEAVITPELQRHVVEAHPEICFWALTGQAMRYKKKSAAGFEERRMALVDAFGDGSIPARSEVRRVVPAAAPDDVLDAIVVAWTARRYAEGVAGMLPEAPAFDARGLVMQIVY